MLFKPETMRDVEVMSVAKKKRHVHSGTGLCATVKRFVADDSLYNCWKCVLEPGRRGQFEC